MIVSAFTIPAVGGVWGAARSPGQASWPGPWLLPPRGRRGSGVRAGRRPPRSGAEGSLEAGGAAPSQARRPSGGCAAAARPPPCPLPRSGGEAVEELRQRLGRGLPAQRLAGPPVQLVGHGLQPPR